MSSKSRRNYVFICKNIPQESFCLQVDREDLRKSVVWLCSLAKSNYCLRNENKCMENSSTIENASSNENSMKKCNNTLENIASDAVDKQKYMIDSRIENIFDNLGFFDYTQSLNEVYLSRVFYFQAVFKATGLRIHYSVLKDKKPICQYVTLHETPTLGQLKFDLAQQLHYSINKILVYRHGEKQEDDSALLSELGINSETTTRNPLRVVLLLQIKLVEPSRKSEDILMNPFQSLKKQISEMKAISPNHFVLLNETISLKAKELPKQNDLYYQEGIIESFENLTDGDTLIFRDLNVGDIQLQLIVFDEDDMDEVLMSPNFTQKSLPLMAYNKDSMELIKILFQKSYDNPYISKLATKDMYLKIFQKYLHRGRQFSSAFLDYF